MKSTAETMRPLPVSHILGGGMEGDARQILAAKAMVQLSSQFAADPSLERLAESLALTVAGQFAVSSVFATFENPDSRSHLPILFAGNQFRDSITPSYAVELQEGASTCLHAQGARLLASLPEEQVTSAPLLALGELGVHVIASFQHRQRVIGLIGLGARIGRKEYTPADLALIDLLVQAVTPLVANAFMVSELTQQAAWYRDILNSVRHGVVVVGIDRRVRNVNLAALRLLRDAGVTTAEDPDHVSYTSFEDLFPNAVFPDWSHRLLTDEVAAAEGRPVVLPAWIFGEEQLFSITTGTLPTSSAQEPCLLLTFQDITDEKQSEQRLFELEKFAERGMMASSIAHELNNFLGLILGGSELAAAMLEKQRLDRVSSSLEKLRDNALKMQRFTASLTDYSRMDTTKQRANLNAIITDVISFVAIQKRFSRIAVCPHLSPALEEFEMDQDQMAQLIINMLNNAADAILEAGRADGRIVVSTERRGSGVQLVVTDNGCGMTEEVRSRMFNVRFTSKPTGHGYGLMVCSKIIANHGGTVNIESSPSNGSAITITLQIIPASS